MTHYEVLGEAETASQALIDAAWKIQMKECHPDLHKGKKAAKQAQVVNEAHDVLSDLQKRAAYDLQLWQERGAKPGVKRNVGHGHHGAFDDVVPIDQRWDDQQGYYPQPYANMVEELTSTIGEAFLETLMQKNPTLVAGWRWHGAL